jgi:hypothetical protein
MRAIPRPVRPGAKLGGKFPSGDRDEGGSWARESPSSGPKMLYGYPDCALGMHVLTAMFSFGSIFFSSTAEGEYEAGYP